MLSKFVIMLMISLVALGLQTNSCNHRTDDKRVSLGGPDKRASIVVFLKKGTTNNEIEDFLKDVVQIEKYNLALMFRLSKDDYDGVGVSFSTDTTPEQREQLKKAIEESPIVYKIFENVVPNEIKLE